MIRYHHDLIGNRQIILTKIPPLTTLNSCYLVAHKSLKIYQIYANNTKQSRSEDVNKSTTFILVGNKFPFYLLEVLVNFFVCCIASDRIESSQLLDGCIGKGVQKVCSSVSVCLGSSSYIFSFMLQFFWIRLGISVF